MARDKITVDLMLATKQAEREIAKINRKLGDMGKTMGKAFGGTGAGGDKVRALGTGLSKATVKADEFSKSMEASNARVIAFGASAGLIMGIDRALKAMVASAIKVEKAMMDVNVVMNVSTQALDKFGKGMFRVAKETAQGFDTVAEAATELARQGLGATKTLQRTKDALILTRLTGMSAVDAVKSLTAAVNSFNKEGVTSAEVINRMAKVDAKFAVSSEDLAKSISRVGASAVSAGVSMNELMAITTAVQQRTARGGAVIGNAFKTIFTRIQRSDVRKTLGGFNIATRDMQGSMLSGIKVLQNLADNFDNLTKSQQSSVSEQVAGVFQVNILKAALADLSQETSAYSGALRAANSATDEAYQKNIKLNQTLDSLVNKTLANLTQAGASLGGGLFGPAIENILGTVNSVIESFGKGGAMEEFGQTIGKGLMKGMGRFIGGPGLIMATAVFAKVAMSLAKFAKQALMDVVGLNTATKQRLALEEAVVATIASEPALLAKVRSGTLSVLTVEQQILNTIRLQTAERAKLQAYAAPIAGALMGRGARVGGKGAFMKGGPGGAAGFVPNFADVGSERAAAAAGGYQAGAIKTMSQPGAGTMMYNSAETVKRFPGMSQSAIMPPQGSPAGAGYKAAFGAAHGFDPYAADGFVPNFVRAPKPKFKKTRAEKKGFAKAVSLNANIPVTSQNVGVITESGSNTTPISFSNNAFGKSGKGIPGLRNVLSKWVGQDGRKVDSALLGMTGIPVVPIFPFSETSKKTMKASKTESAFNYLKSSLTKYSKDLSHMMFGHSKVGTGGFDMDSLSSGTAGDIFEQGVRTAVGGATMDDKQAAFDYNGKKYASSHLIGFFNSKGATRLKSASKIEGKIGFEAAKDGNIPKKVWNDGTVGPSRSQIIKAFRTQFKALAGAKSKTPGKASGFIPNFSPLTTALGREMQAGVPASAIRVGSSSALKSPGNPGGVGVYNTVHEPGGLSQGISRARSQGIDPRGHGAGGGFVPNFMVGSVVQRAAVATPKLLQKLINMFKGGKVKVKAGLEKGAGAGTRGMMGGAVGGIMEGWTGVGGSIAAGAGAGAIMGGGIPGALIGGGAALLFELPRMFRLLTDSGEEVVAEVEKQIAVQKELATSAQIAKGALEKLSGAAKSVEGFEGVKAGIIEGFRGSKDFSMMEGSPEFKALGKAASGSEMQAGMAAFEERLRQKKRVGALPKDPVGLMGDTYDSEVGGSYRDPRAEMISAIIGSSKIGEDGKRVGTGGDIGLSLAQRFTPEEFRKMEGGPMEAVEMFAALLNVPEKDLEEFSKQLEKAVGGRGGNGVGLLGLQTALRETVFNQETYNEGLKRLRDLTAASTLATIADDRVTAREGRFGLRLRSEQIGRQGAFNMSMVGLRNQSRMASANATLGARGGADVQMGNALSTAQTKFRGSQDQAAIDFQKQVADGLGKLDLGKFITNFQQGMSEGQAARSKEAFEGITQGNLSIDALEEELKRLRDLNQMGLLDETRVDELTKLEFLPKIIETLRKSSEDLKSKQIANSDTLDNSTKIAKEKNKIDKEAIKLQHTINLQKRQEAREIAASLAAAGLGEANTLVKQGKMGARGRGAAYSANLSKQVAARGVGKGDFATAFKAGFVNEMGYEPVDMLEDWESGTRSVAQSMKSSFADAFQSISSGASSVQGALANMAQSILNSISSISTNMFTNMMFSKMGWQGSQGGLVPGYAGGGVVTGGSGHKDDVPTMMQGGEFVIKKSSAQKIGYGKLNAINGYAEGGPTQGPSMWKMGAIGAGASALSGVIGASMQPGAPSPLPSRDYGFGKGKHGYFGGADPDAGQTDMISGARGSAGVSLGKGFVYYRRDPETGRLISERARPTEGRFEVSQRLSLLGRLGDDPQTSRMFGKEQTMSKYQDYLETETQSRKDQINAVKKQKRSRLIGAYMNAAMLIGGAKMMEGAKAAAPAMDQVNATGMPDWATAGTNINYGPTPDVLTSSGMPSWALGQPGDALGGYKHYANGGSASGTPAMVMGGEYIMSPETVRTYGTNFMSELNRGNAPSYQGGGPVGGASLGNQGGPHSETLIGGNTTNNVKINVNVDKNGKTDASASAGTGTSSGDADKTDRDEVENNKALGQLLQGVVLEEIVKQQRPGGLLRRSPNAP